MKHTLLLSTLLIIACPPVWACSPARLAIGNNAYYTQLNKEPAKMILSSNREYLMKLIPPHFTFATHVGWKESRASKGVAYKITHQGTLQQLWMIKNVSTGGNYYLADDGVHFVKVSNSVKNLDDKEALQIYNRGQLFRNYPATTFITPDPKRVRTKHSCGGMFWGVSEITLAGRTLNFSVDGKQWNFDIRQPPK